MVVGGPATGHAESNEPSTEQALAEYVAAGRKAPADIDSASLCGSARGETGQQCAAGSATAGEYARDTVGSGPVMSSALAAFAYNMFHPDAAPPGANDWNCRPSADHPRPVILLHGTWMSAYDNFAFMGQPIKDAGFCTFAFNYGRSNPLAGGGLGSLLPGAGGVGHVENSAQQLSAFVDRVLAATGAHEVDLVAHSQGGPMANWYLKYDGGAAKVRQLISFGATYHGTSFNGIGTLGRTINNLGIDVLGLVELPLGHAPIELIADSEFLHRLNAGGDTAADVEYTVVATRYDEVTNPFPITFLTPTAGATVHNITLQDGCAQDLSDHLTMMYSPRALSIALRALDPSAHPALTCTFNPWLIGGGGTL
ncbi:esterase/lipase family protein [Nocardia brasiliensis]|uniref:esterase/lipase family protein n=1 Tax=Nocardia brasiliensis TaxID=37326 RepID=UPI002456F7A9|nr:alpha/beta fold hydrolase [Nocardia brasiliensis]